MAIWGPVLVGAGIAAAGSIAGGMIGSQAGEEAAQLQKKIYKKTRKDLAPWRIKGEKALEKLWSFIEDPSKITEMPGYQFALGEGTKALLRSRSATGDLLSGATGKALTRYGQEYATTNYLNYLRPYQDLSRAGQSAAAMTGQFAQDYAGQAGRNILASGGAKVGMIGNLTNALTSGVKDYYYLNLLQNMPK